MTPLQNLTIAQLQKEAEEFKQPYERMYQKVVRHVFIEAVSWAIKVANGEIKVKDEVMEKRFFKKVGNWLFIIAVLIVSVNSALKGNFEGFIWPLVALGFYYALCVADYLNDDLIAIVEAMIQALNNLERQLKEKEERK